MMFGPDTNSILERIEFRLEGIYRLLELQTRPQIEAKLKLVATTKERRKMWLLSDGGRKTDDIARLAGAALRTVQLFVQDADRGGLIDTSRRGYPKRRFSIVPDDWTSEIAEVDKAVEEEVTRNPSGGAV